ncbi:MAG: hypothetical protein FJ083_07345 [Cyanobacteria bacterium K_Offshore_surface_m2_239]|nr:hypothetical protein [Cyanobacteria bacterium K_Offshore_surface_m2_239]
MARLAKSDAELYRAIGDQNATVRELVDDLAPVNCGSDGIPAVATSSATTPSAASLAPVGLPSPSLAPVGLLPREACDLKALKARFGRAAEAQAWLESQLGPAPKKPTWAVIAQTCRDGVWPASARSRAATRPGGLTARELEDRLQALEQRLLRHLESRLDRMEALVCRLVVAMESPERPSP